ncbi:MAG: hypothetical protein MUC60_04505 [Oscillatoria sp. Prado101]|jgi:hypothetical protein|nr:hypothetical protein [Oscillatoria sp. Prado101]
MGKKWPLKKLLDSIENCCKAAQRFPSLADIREESAPELKSHRHRLPALWPLDFASNCFG